MFGFVGDLSLGATTNAGQKRIAKGRVAAPQPSRGGCCLARRLFDSFVDFCLGFCHERCDSDARGVLGKLR